MSNLQLVVLIVVTALAASGCTLALGFWVFQRWLRPQLEARLAASADVLEARVKAGAAAAATEILPAFREEVRNGFADAIASLATTEMLDRTARKVVRTGSSLMESGLSLLRGARPDRSDEPPPD